MTDLPQEAVEALRRAAELEVVGLGQDGAVRILEAAAPFIAAQERERLRRELLSDKALDRAQKALLGWAAESEDGCRFTAEEAIKAALDALAPESVEEPEK